MSLWGPAVDEFDDHYLGLPGANVVATEALLAILWSRVSDTSLEFQAGIPRRAVSV